MPKKVDPYMQNMSSLWAKIADIYAPSPAERNLSDQLLAIYQRRGYLPKACREMLGYSHRVIAQFYAQLAADGDARSPAQGHPDSRWMADSDFCFINVRATGLGTDFGTFIQAAKLLPAIRANALHLGPFTQYAHGVIYIVESIASIAPQVVDAYLLAQGIGPEEQLRAFVQAVHLLGKVVGFDLEPHVGQFAIPVLMRPELFRWIKLYALDKRWLDDYLSNEDMLRYEHQQRLTAQVRAIVTQVLQQSGLEDLEPRLGDDATTCEHKQATYHRIIHTLIDEGYWTVPSQIWAGAGIPAFDDYNFEGNYAEFRHLSRTGEDLSAGAYHALTPYAFYHNIPVNRAPDLHAPPQRNDAAWDYYSDIFAKWRDDFDFDFVRYDSVDHIFDSLLVGDSDLPDSDRPTPAVLAHCISASKTPEKPHIGTLAERMGDEVEAYAAMGFDLMLGSDMLDRVDCAHMEKSFALYDRLMAINQNRPVPFSVTYAVETHDTGNPYMWGEPLLKRMGPRRMRLRYFVARFISCGMARRPKYEVMGVQDMSYGLYRANVTESNLTWVGDTDFNRFYHVLEDIYARYRDFLAAATLIQREVTGDYAWWMIQNGPRWLVPVIALEQGEAETAPPISVDISLPASIPCVHQYDFTLSEAISVILTSNTLAIRDLPYLGFVLYDIVSTRGIASR